jgi:hypothetical protein
MSAIVCGCGKSVEEQADRAGQWITCPGCGGALYQPFPGPKPSTPTVLEETRLCAVCSETIPVADAVCRYCRGNPDGVAPVARPVATPPPPPASAGDTGVGFLVVSLIGWFVCGLLCPVAWMMASAHERECRAKGLEFSGPAKAGKIIGIIGTIYLAINLCFLALWLVAACL